MSKMTKLLTKVQMLRDNPYEASAAQEKIQEPQHASFDEMHNHQDNFKGFSNLSLGFIMLVLMVAIASLVVSYKAVVEMNSSRMATVSLLEQINVQSDSIKQLKVTYSEKDLKELEEMKKLNGHIAKLSDDLQKSQIDVREERQEIDRLVKEYNLLLESTEEVRATNRLLLQKFISLNQEIQNIKANKPLTTAKINEQGISSVQ